MNALIIAAIQQAISDGVLPASLNPVENNDAVQIEGADASLISEVDPQGNPDPQGGQIDRDPATGRLTGKLRERGTGPFEQVIPQTSTQRFQQCLFVDHLAGQ